MERKRRVWDIVIHFCAVLGALGLAGCFYYSINYGNHNPTTPDSRSGRIHPYNYHGTVVYLNDDELMRIRLSEGALYIGVLGFIVLGAHVYGFRKQ